MNPAFKYLLVFICGVAIGRFFFQSEPAPERPREVVSEPPAPAPVAKAPPQESQRQPASAPPVKIMAMQATMETAPLARELREPQKQALQLNISEGTIERLENEWNDLPLQVRARRENRGWRIESINEQSALFSVGLREHDLVTEEFLRNLRDADPRLAYRMQQILNHVTR